MTKAPSIVFLCQVACLGGASALQLRRYNFANEVASIGDTDVSQFLAAQHDASSSFLALISASKIAASADGADWWLWIVIGGVIGLVALLTISFRKPNEGVVNELKRLVLNTKIVSCQQIVTRASPQIDPIQLGVSVKGKTASGEFIELFHQESGHEIEGSSTKFNWEDPEMSWVLTQPLQTAPNAANELMISVEQYSSSGALVAVVATGIVSLKPPIVGAVYSSRFMPQMIELISTAAGSSVWGSLEFSLQYEPLDSNDPLNQLLVAQKQIFKKLRVVKPLFMAAHSLAVGLIILDSFFGIRFLFSGCFVSSVQAMVSAGMISLLSIPMAAEWGQMHYALPGWMVKIGKLNSQFKASVLLICAVPQQVIATITGSPNCASLFSVVGGLSFVDFLLFSALFVQQEANGHIVALFHFNCFKRPLPPAVPPKASRTDGTASNASTKPGAGNPPTQASPGSYAARRAARQQAASLLS